MKAIQAALINGGSLSDRMDLYGALGLGAACSRRAEMDNTNPVCVCLCVCLPISGLFVCVSVFLSVPKYCLLINISIA